ncbi:MAG: alpha/beta fold hydrolase [Phycisphaerales bacterium]|nr:alpha/beta fold hydrolase [Phycisphaerales bacterium]
MPPFLGLLQLLTTGALAFWIILTLYTAYSLLHPPKRTYAYALWRNLPGDPSELDTPLDYEQFNFKSNRQTLMAWKIKALNPSPQTAPRLLLIHGWGSSSIGALQRIPHLQNLASEIITLDLPGHGESTGTAQMGTTEHQDLHNLLNTLDPKPTIIFGWSMGAGIALRLAKDHAKDHNIKAIIAESPYIHAITPARNVIHLRGLPTYFNLKPAIWIIGLLKGVSPKWHGFARDQLATDLNLPLLIIHGSNDPVSPIADSKTITAASPNTTLLQIDQAGHNNIWTTPNFTAQATTAIKSFIASTNT